MIAYRLSPCVIVGFDMDVCSPKWPILVKILSLGIFSGMYGLYYCLNQARTGAASVLVVPQYARTSGGKGEGKHCIATLYDTLSLHTDFTSLHALLYFVMEEI